MAITPQAGAFAAGCAEAAATWQEMVAYWGNYVAAEYGAAGPSPGLQSFMAAQLAWVRAQVAAYNDSGRQLSRAEISGESRSARAWRRQTDAQDAVFWTGMGNLIAAFDGLVYFHTRLLPAGAGMEELSVYMLNSVGDLEDLNGLFPNADYGRIGTPAARRALSPAGRAQSQDTGPAGQGAQLGVGPMPLRDKLLDCSAFIRVLPDLSDVTLGHTTWRSYYAMLRSYKVYNLPYTRAGVMQYSSSPGLLQSKDDWAVTPQFVAMETTNSVFNRSLFGLVTPQSALTWQRNQIASAYAVDGEDWTQLFALYNSGTYNNQWMVADAQRFAPGSQPAPGFLWITEQIPGACPAADVTPVLVAQGYWASYNIPYLPAVFEASGYPSMVAKYGDEYSYENCSRARIFARNASAVDGLLATRALLRYNNFETDPLSGGDPILGSVSSRGDLRAGAPVAFGGVDTKAIALSSLLPGAGAVTVLAESGPTHDQQPVFGWANSSAFAGVVHDLVPAVFDFPTIAVSLQWR
jgi:hypothetical protein